VPRKSAFNFVAPCLHMLQDICFLILCILYLFGIHSNDTALSLWKSTFKLLRTPIKYGPAAKRTKHVVSIFQDEKVQRLLGHFRKKFDGPITFENLGKRTKNCHTLFFSAESLMFYLLM